MVVDYFCTECSTPVAYDSTEYLWGCECFATRTVEEDGSIVLEFIPDHWVNTEEAILHTKGPWVIEWMPFMGEYDSEGERNPDVAFVGPSRDDAAVAIVFPPEGENPHDSPTLKANAALIAAAPDLLEALEGLLAHTVSLYASGSSAIFAIVKAEQAIARAKGKADE